MIKLTTSMKRNLALKES